MNQTTIKELQNLLDGKVIIGHKMMDSDLDNALIYLFVKGIVYRDPHNDYTINPNKHDNIKHLQKFIELNNLDKFNKYYINYNPNKKSFLEKFESYLNITNSIIVILSFSGLYTLYKYFNAIIIFIQKLF